MDRSSLGLLEKIENRKGTENDTVEKIFREPITHAIINKGSDLVCQVLTSALKWP